MLNGGFSGKECCCTSLGCKKESGVFKSLSSDQLTLLFFGSEKELVGDFNPSEKYARQNGSFPQIGMNIKNI